MDPRMAAYGLASLHADDAADNEAAIRTQIDDLVKRLEAAQAETDNATREAHNLGNTVFRTAGLRYPEFTQSIERSEEEGAPTYVLRGPGLIVHAAFYRSSYEDLKVWGTSVHSSVPLYEGQEPYTGGCSFHDGDCYSQELSGYTVLKALQRGEEFLWRELYRAYWEYVPKEEQHEEPQN